MSAKTENQQVMSLSTSQDNTLVLAWNVSAGMAQQLEYNLSELIIVHTGIAAKNYCVETEWCIAQEFVVAAG